VQENYFKDLLGRYREDQLTEAEKRLIDTWYDTFDDPAASPLESPISRERIHKQLAGRIKAHTRTAKVVRLPLRYAAAASILVFFLATILLITLKPAERKANAWYVIHTAPGQLRELKMPDGSKIWLNAGSVLKFNQSTFLTQRNVYLEDGEAFFEVTKDKQHPFSVISPKIVTKVYGTSFNVKAYKKLSYSTVHVRTGKVIVSSGANHFPDTLHANQMVVYNHNLHLFKKEDQSTFSANSWVNGITNIRDASFNELALIFYNQFKLKLISIDKETLGHHYSVTIFHDQPLEMTLKLICSIHHNHYRRDQNVVTIIP
jgi:ferric-dicitrate binding protein FerR (iron transport regulator)